MERVINENGDDSFHGNMTGAPSRRRSVRWVCLSPVSKQFLSPFPRFSISVLSGGNEWFVTTRGRMSWTGGHHIADYATVIRVRSLTREASPLLRIHLAVTLTQRNTGRRAPTT